MAVGGLSQRDLIFSLVALFIAWGYIVHWLPTLRWTVHCFVIGFILSPCVILYHLATTSRTSFYANRNKIARPPGLIFLGQKEWERETAALSERRLYHSQPLYPESFLISSALDEILDLIERDFVKSWYNSISSNPVFTNQVDHAIRGALINIRDRLLSIDLTVVITERFIPILTAHFRDFYDAERSVRGKRFDRSVTESEELDLAIAGKFRDGILHPAASLTFSNMKMAQVEHVRVVIQKLLPRVLGVDVIGSKAVCVLIEEMISCAVVVPVIQLLADPDTWNQVIENYGQSMLQDRSTVRKLRAALDEHAIPKPRASTISTIPKLNPNDNERRFEKFVRAVRKVNNLSDARRFRSEVSSQLKRDATIQDVTYLRRLDIGKRILDKRVDQLSGTPLGAERSNMLGGSLSESEAQELVGGSKLENGNLIDLLRNPAGLSYFMEYMDRQHMLPLVQFWIVVDGFRNPLEEDTIEDNELPSTLPTWGDADRADLAQIHEAYLSRPEVNMPELSKKDVQVFLRAGKAATPEQYYRARRSILRTQTAALEKMSSRYYPDFKTSDLFYKCLTSQEASSHRTTPGSLNPFDGGSEELHCSRTRAQHASTSQNISSHRSSNVSSHISRQSSHNIPSIATELRRSASSATDLTAFMHKRQLSNLTSPIRRSFQTNRRFSSLFGSDEESDDHGLSNSVHGVDLGDDADANFTPDQNVLSAVGVALNDIMKNSPDTNESRASSLDEPTSPTASLMFPSAQADVLHRQPITTSTATNEILQREERPSISSLGLVNTSSRIGVFTDDDLFPDEEKYISDEYDDLDLNKDDDVSSEIHEAAPGDLGLAEAVAALTVEINRLMAQNSIVDSLTRKAELTNNNAELRILRKSHASLLREVRRKELQRQQYMMQESSNSLYGQSSVRIHKILVGRDEDKREFALYVVEVRRKAGEQKPSVMWTVKRRYSEFLELHQKLRERYPSVRHMDFPRRRAIMNFTNDFLQKRRIALEKYLRELLLLPQVCRDRDLRNFLSQSTIANHETKSSRQDKKDIMTRFYNSVQDGMEDILGNVPAIDQLSSTGQNFISQLATSNPHAGLSTATTLATAEAEAELSAFENQAVEPFVKPICDIFLEIFELNRGTNWLRGRAVIVVLHQLLGGTIEKKIRDGIKGLIAEDAVLKYIATLKSGLWDEVTGGQRRSRQFRTVSLLRIFSCYIDILTTRLQDADKAQSRREAGLCLATLLPDLVGGVVGRVNAQAASRRIFATLNNSRLKFASRHSQELHPANAILVHIWLTRSLMR